MLLGAAGAALATALPAGAQTSTRQLSTKSKNKLQDLTHVLRKEFPLFLGTTIPTERDVIVTVSPELTLEELVRPLVVIDISKRGDTDAYLNVGPDGKQRFPGFGKDAVEWLIARRDIAAIGVDTLSLDPGEAASFDAHVTILSANRYGIENLRQPSPRATTGGDDLRRHRPVGARVGRPARVWAQW